MYCAILFQKSNEYTRLLLQNFLLYFVYHIILFIFELVTMIRIDTKKIYIANYDLQRFLKAINDLR